MRIDITIEDRGFNYLETYYRALQKEQDRLNKLDNSAPLVILHGNTITIQALAVTRSPLKACFDITTYALFAYVTPKGPDDAVVLDHLAKLASFHYAKADQQELICQYLSLLEPSVLDLPSVKITLSAKYPKERTIVFIEGGDGVGKSTLIAKFSQCRTLAEMGSIPSDKNPYLPLYNTKQLVLGERARVPCPSRDMHYTFAERWHIWTSIVNAPTASFTLCDRSWLSGLVYQGSEGLELVHLIKNEGRRLDKYLRDNKYLPIYLVLNNAPYRTDVTDSLETGMDEKRRLYAAINMPELCIHHTVLADAEKYIKLMLN